MKQFNNASLIVATLLGAGLLAVPVMAQNQDDCEDRITSGGWIDTSFGSTANFGAHGGLDPSDPTQLKGNLNYVHREVDLHVVAHDVTGYCRCPGNDNCRRITYENAKVNYQGQQLTCTVYIEVCDLGEPPTADTFSICIPCIGYCESGVLGGDAKPSGGNIQLHASDPGCGGNLVPICAPLVLGEGESCDCFDQCIVNGG
jgi:hypothetical protein